MIEMLEMLEDVPLINYNLADNEGNTPLHLAAQGRRALFSPVVRIALGIYS